MLQSQLFTKTRKEAPQDEVSKNAQLLIRAGYIHKEMAGVYTLLPLGYRVFNKIVGIIREEMDAIGGQELLMTSLQDPERWKKTDRWDEDKMDVWFRTSLKNGGELGLANTHEEAIAELMRSHIQSYKDLPVFAYQFQTKFRNETRAKSGIMRAREFVMKDLYSFTRSDKDLDVFYDACAEAYKRIFERAGIGDRTFMTFASGGAFSRFSHEFQTLCDAGEDVIYYNKERGIAVNKEVFEPEVLKELGLDEEGLTEGKAIEVGNIFKLGTRFSEPLGLSFRDEDGLEKPVIMGSYGIGPGRLMGTVVEVLSDEKGIVWPDELAPFDAHVIEIAGGDERVKAWAETLYHEMSKSADVLYDDRDARAGEKFADSDLLGIPKRVVVSAKNLESKMLEVKDRRTGEVTMVSQEELLATWLRRND